MSLRSICICLALTACSPQRADTSHAPAGSERALPERFAALQPAVVAGGVIVLGEMHGTAELPAFAAELLAELGPRPLVLGLEIPRSEQDVLDAYVAGSGTASERARVLDRPWWKADYQDGRRSVAMFELVEAVRALRAGGAAVRIVAFDTEDAPGERDLVMAERLIEARAAQPDATLVVLVGNLHAARGEVEGFAGKTWMVGHLERAGVKALTLRVAYEQGTPWVCFDGEPEHCGPAEMKGAPVGAPGVRLSQTSPNYDGEFAVPRLTASPPVARPELGEARFADADARRDAGAAYDAGDFGRCATELGKLKAPLVFDAYNHACCLARSGDADGAFAALERAKQLGLAGVDLAADEDLNGLRGDPRWGAIAAAVAASAREG